MRARTATAGMMLIMVSLSGCGNGAVDTQQHAKTEGSRKFTQYLPTESQLTAIRNAQTNLMASCLRKYGIHKKIEAPDNSPVYRRIRSAIDLPRTAKAARKHGYQSGPRGHTHQESKDAGSGGKNNITKQKKDLLTVLNGPKDHQPARVNGVVVHPGGCLHESFRVLHRGTPDIGSRTGGRNAMNALLWMHLKVDEKYKSDPTFLEMLGRWRSCMKAAGHPYDTPHDAANDPAWEKQSTASEKEKLVAQADMKCRTAADFNAVSNALRTHYEDILVAHKSKLFAEIAETFAVMTRNAKNTENQSSPHARPAP